MTGRTATPESAPILLDRFHLALVALGPLPSEGRLLIALSGGSDSVALLSLVLAWRDRYHPEVEVTAGHLDHRLRGAASSGDAKFCRDLAHSLGVSCTVEEVDVAARASRDRVSIETAGREARLATFARWGRQKQVTAVLTAHHQDDQVETVLLHLLRGAGVRGLAGMPARRPLPGLPEVELWRPCLAFSRAELATYRISAGLPHREDVSNRCLAPRRNRIRHQLLPLLRGEWSPSAESALLSIATGARSEVQRLARQVEPLLEEVRIAPPHAALPPAVVEVLQVVPALASTVLFEVWSRSQGRSGALTRDHHRIWRRFIDGVGDGHHYDLPRGASIDRAGGWVLVFGSARPPRSATPPILIPDRGTIEWRGAQIRAGTEKRDSPTNSLSARLPAGSDLFVRGARTDDRIHLDGIAHRVGELLRSAGIPARWRVEYPVIAGTEGVIWIPGIRPPNSGGTRTVEVVPSGDVDPIGFLLGLHRFDAAHPAIRGMPEARSIDLT